MKIVKTVAEMQKESAALRTGGATIGVVPTMGALHSGHASLITASALRHPATIVTVFVNPTQFGPADDFARYPRTPDEDAALAEQYGATHLFIPDTSAMYPQGYSTMITVGRLSTVLEGAVRPGHFDGVATVVCKLFAATHPHEAYFGQKDYQQTLIIKRMTRDLNLGVGITVCPTIREADGLALSSRNRYLTSADRVTALALYRALRAGRLAAHTAGATGKTIEDAMLQELSGLQVDYVAAVHPDTLEPLETVLTGDTIVLLVAARLGSTRLIDNVIVTVGSDAD
ncbi:MAG: pantoate--beta-alanine ligase [Flavobacteriales bacterium]|nr:MAG: pantoate--beta-alanine ligase [Bacteroidota bacterium]MBE2264710.1 pantoate--beta-alanine ligase [Flavobacteriales bacterium]MBV6464283.1 Pantothenate synthetase [Chlorobiota bacterium]MBW7853790.1 pantoate--beta-alanine ligase [Candidatus Kapabacteria bacterium]MCC6330530.1 pantoate--beta-alanine ligase [Ignavibacteria bacterium]